MEPFTLIIFGATGNLSSIKLLPTLYDLLVSSSIPVPFNIVGIGRRDLGEAGFRAFVSEVLRAPNRHHTHDIDEEVEARLLDKLRYLNIDSSKEDFGRLSALLASLPTGHNRLYYLATYPSLYHGIFDKLEASGLSSRESGWVRVMIEKPLGKDLASAKSLNELMAKYYDEDQLFRLDHYLGKSTLQNILTFRFDNGVFEPLMTSGHLDHIEVSATEDFGIGSRGGYYDQAGALLDVGQNHLLQMLAVALMPRPKELSNEEITSSRLTLLESLEPLPSSLVIGQYEGYQTEASVAKESKTETFFSFATKSNLPHLKGVPIYVRAGKYLEATATEVALFFKNTPNVLIYRLQPNEGIVLKFLTNDPWSRNKDEAFMQYCYRTSDKDLPDAYHNLIVSALEGDQTFFNDAGEIEAQWRFIDPLVNVKHDLTLHRYARGTWGPEDSNKITKWLKPSTVFCNL